MGTIIFILTVLLALIIQATSIVFRHNRTLVYRNKKQANTITLPEESSKKKSKDLIHIHS